MPGFPGNVAGIGRRIWDILTMTNLTLSVDVNVKPWKRRFDFVCVYETMTVSK